MVECCFSSVARMNWLPPGKQYLSCFCVDKNTTKKHHVFLEKLNKMQIKPT